MQIVVVRLTIRSLTHDNSKLTPSEMSGFLKIFGSLHANAYGSAGYQQMLEQIKPTLQLHYTRNRHHPDVIGLENMSIYDLVEMVVDWKAAIRKQKEGNLDKSFKINKERFNISEELERILKTL